MKGEFFHRERQFWMQVYVHGEPLEFRWTEGVLTGAPNSSPALSV